MKCIKCDKYKNWLTKIDDLNFDQLVNGWNKMDKHTNTCRVCAKIRYGKGRLI